MRRLLSSLFALALLLLLAPACFADFDLSGLSFDELVALRDQINLAIWNSQEWQEVEVPQGVWQVGADIPAGKWTITCSTGSMCLIHVGSELDASGAAVKYPYKADATLTNPGGIFFDPGDRTSFDVELSSGDYVEISGTSAVFSPYAGKPSLGFK